MQPGYARLRGSEADAGGDVEAEEEDNRPESDAAVEDNYGSLWDDVDGSNVPEELRSPRDHDAHSIIDVLSSQLQNREIPQYLDEFEVVIPDAEVVVGSVPIEEIQQREQQVEEARLRQAELESNLYRQREIHLAQQEALARERLLQEARRRHAELVLKDRQAAEAMQLRARRIGHVFQQAETHLTDTLKKQEARVEQLYGALMPSRVPQSRKRYRVEWARIPLTIRIRGRMLNAVKDKLPPGQYVMVATLYDRLGGHALHWTNWDPELSPTAEATSDSRTQVGRPNFTRPFHHRGRFYNTEVVVNQDMFVVCPPEVELRPGNTLIFELFLLSQATAAAYAGSNVMSMPKRRRRRGGQLLDQTMAMQTDHVVAWGALPLTTPDFQVVQGTFKLPLLRGEMDHTMDKYQDMEKMFQHDLSSWLCNFYLQVYHLPKPPAILLHRSPRKKHAGDDGFDAEIDERGGLLRLMLPEVENNHQRYMRKMSTLPSNADQTIRKRSQSPVHRRSNGELSTDRALLDSGEESQLAHASSDGKHHGAGVVKPYSSASPLLVDEEEATTTKKKRAKAPPRFLSPMRWRWRRWLTSFGQTRKTRVYSGDAVAMQQNHRHLHKTISVEEEKQMQNGSARLLSGQASSRQLGLDGVRVADHFDSIDQDVEIPEDCDDASLVGRGQQLDVENYTFSVNAAASMETARHQRFHAQRKMHYLKHELLVDLGFSNWHTLEFWRLIAMLLFSCWIRLYVHYLTQWLFLRGSRVPVYDFQPQWTTCVVKYTWQTVATHVEIGLLALGVLGNTMMFAFLSGAAAVGQRYVGDLPAFGSNFVACAGIATVLDPFLVLLVDVLSHHYGCSQLSECAVSLTASGCTCVTGDWFKLYVRFQAQEGSGLVGIFIVVILYVALTCLSLLGLYIYLLYIHMNGRMLDVYRRIHGHEDTFFVPHDAEISLQELQTVCTQATRWKGPRGTQRKVFVHEYALSDPLDPLFRETNTHIAVYNVELDGSRELHRHFLKMPDGAVLELFGELGENTDGNWKSDAPQGAASLALLYNILQDVQQDGNSSSMTSAAIFEGL